MALVISDRVKETTTTSGTGTYTLGGAVTGFETFTANLSDGDTTYYACTDNTDFEIGLGTFTTSGTTLARTTILASSNSGSAVNWAAGTRTIFCTLPAAKAVFLDASGNATIEGDVDIDGITNLDVTDIDGTLNVAGETTLQTHLNMGDGDIIKLGADADLTIQHDGSASYITDSGTGSLNIRGTDLNLQDASGNSYINMSDNGTGGTVILKHNTAIKLTTKTDGILITGEVAATSLDISGDADIDGTLEADAITVGGTALNTVIAGVTVTNATNAVNSTNSAHVLVTDNESTNEENLIAFVEGATSSTGNVGLEMDGNFAYNPSTGTVTATIFKGNIDAVDGDFDGTLEADAITVGGATLNSIIQEEATALAIALG